MCQHMDMLVRVLRKTLWKFGTIALCGSSGLICTSKNSFRSHLRAIMILDHSRLSVENKSGRIFAFDKFTLKSLAHKSGCVQTNLLYLLYITSEEKEYYEALFLSYRPRTKCSSSQFFKTNCIYSVFRTIEARVDF